MQIRETSLLSDSSQGTGALTSGVLLDNNLSLPLSVTAVYPLQSKKTTLRGKSSSCEKGIRKPKSLQTSAVDSTSSEKDLKPYWDDFCRETSLRLWLPTETVLSDSDLNSFSTCVHKTVGNSWFSTVKNTVLKPNLPKICSPSFMSSPAECTGSESTVQRSKKIRIYPNAEQRNLFRQWFGTARKAYNDTIEYLKGEGTKANWKGIKGPLIDNLPEWADSIPYQIKSIAIRDACIAVSSAKKKCLKGGKFQDCKFKSKKSPKQSCYIPKSSATAAGIYPRLTKGMKYAEPMSEDHGDCRLVQENNRWFLIVPVVVQRKPTDNQSRIVAIDPGVRTFATYFSETECGKIGNGAFERVIRLCYAMDQLKSKMSNAQHKQRYKMKKAFKRLGWRLKDSLSDLHHKTALYFVKNYDYIVLPTFEVSDMVKRVGRNISAKSVRSMLTLGHYSFKQILKDKADMYGKTVIDANEAYTTKTVSWTGEVRHSMGGAKFIKSGTDVMDRDYNGARGIFLRALRDHSILRDAILPKEILVDKQGSAKIARTRKAKGVPIQTALGTLVFPCILGLPTLRNVCWTQGNGERTA